MRRGRQSPAEVEAVSRRTGFHREAMTANSGTYVIAGLPVGTYDVTFSKAGFKPVEVKDVELSVGQPRTPDARLDIGVTASTVEVSARVNRTSAEVGGTIESAQIKGSGQRPV